MQGLFRLQDNTPEAYTEDSRDFQLMLRLYDCTNNGVMFYIDSMRNVTDTKMCSSDLLGLLKTKIGFFSDVDFTDRELRYILRGFPSIIKYKGSIKGIREAVYMYMNANGMSCPHKVYVDNDTHTVAIHIEHSITDTSILDEVFKYIIPAGYAIQYIFYSPLTKGDRYDYRGTGLLLNASDSYNSVLRGSEDSGDTYGFRQAATNSGVGYKIEGSISLSNGVLSGVVFTAASSSLPHLYDPSQSTSWSSDGESWAEDSDYSPYGICIDGTPSSCSVDGMKNRPISLYSLSNTWTNYSNEVLGTVGNAVIIGSKNTTDVPDTLRVGTFSD